ncbi:mannosyltransferase, partial [Nowakowskiella sp. JEL0078]
MNTTTLAFSFILGPSSSLQIYCVVFFVAIGAFIGWPFSGAAVGLAFAVELLFFHATPISNLRRLIFASLSALILGSVVMVDYLFYRKLVIVPLNIVLYNVFGDIGPNIYGTEPWTFYFVNGILNFNVVFLAAIASLPLLLLTDVSWGIKLLNINTSPHLLSLRLVPVFLWLLIFTRQPHKEERFLFINLKAIVSFCFIIVFILLSLSRTIGLYVHYHAHISVYEALEVPNVVEPTATNQTLCVGKEWYRFPSHYLLPGNMRLRFIQSDFRGQLPGYFQDDLSGSMFRIGTYADPTNRMNDQNLEELDRYVELESCNFLVDSDFPARYSDNVFDASVGEPRYVLDTQTWKRVHCERFLDSVNTAVLARAFWVPESLGVSDKKDIDAQITKLKLQIQKEVKVREGGENMLKKLTDRDTIKLCESQLAENQRRLDYMESELQKLILRKPLDKDATLSSTVISPDQANAKLSPEL